VLTNIQEQSDISRWFGIQWKTGSLDSSEKNTATDNENIREFE
jgi:hypothetical protein